MIPPTINGLPSMACVSAMQKCIRRGLERQAMEFACELLHTSKAFCTMVTNRLEIISHEDVDTINAPWIIPYVATACAQARAWYDPEKLGKSRMAIGNCIRLLARAPKSREGDHFHAAVGLRSLIDGYVPEIPDWAQDQHTLVGKRMGRGLDYFRAESTKLVPAPKRRDAYENEAYEMWEKKHRLKPATTTLRSTRASGRGAR